MKRLNQPRTLRICVTLFATVVLSLWFVTTKLFGYNSHGCVHDPDCKDQACPTVTLAPDIPPTAADMQACSNGKSISGVATAWACGKGTSIGCLFPPNMPDGTPNWEYCSDVWYCKMQ